MSKKGWQQFYREKIEGKGLTPKWAAKTTWIYLIEENAKLREAAQDVVESEMDARRQQVTHWQNPTIDALAALLEASDER